MSKWRTFGRPDEGPPPPFDPHRNPNDHPPELGSVAWLVNLCPRCRSKEIEITHTHKLAGAILRRHKCRACSFRFKSHESD